MERRWSEEALACASVTFAQAGRLLYEEPSSLEVADQVLGRRFEGAPFGGDFPRAAEGLRLMDGWCAAALADAEAAGSAAANPEQLAESSVFSERVGDLRRDWLRLFAGVGVPLASCLESYYTDAASRMFTESTLEVRRAYRAHGLQPEKLHSEPDDHLGLMLGFLSVLLDEEAEAAARDDVAAAEALAGEQRAFLATHALPWLAAWQSLVVGNAATDYYRGVGLLVFGLCQALAARFGIVYSEERRAFSAR